MSTNNTIEIPSHLEIDVRRPNGDVETIRHPTMRSLTKQQFAAMQQQTRAAGRGEVLSYRNVTKTVPAIEPDEYELHETRMAKMQRESVVR